MNNILAQLNEQQQRAVTAIEGPVLVLAGPGSGKTRVLTHRIAYLVRECGITPYHIMAVTFTNKAAREMRARTERLLGMAGGMRGLTLGTFHGICARWLRHDAEQIGIPRDYVIYDSADQLSLVRAVLKELNLDDKLYRPQAVLVHISRTKSELITPAKYEAQTYWQEVAGRVYERYQELLRANHALDFDDLLLEAVRLLREVPEVQERCQQRYKHILVDEFQDTNMAQYELISLLGRSAHSVFVVGDEDQSVYGWRGADYRNVQRFREDFPDVRTILLERNYRSTQTILDTANAVIARNLRRVPKKLHTDKGHGPLIRVFEAYNESEEGSFVCDEIARLHAQGLASPGECAIMYRTNAQSRAIEEAFLHRNLPYKLVGATRFYERKEIKDALAYLRVIHNPNDNISLQRIVNTPTRGIGSRTLAQLNAWTAQMGLSLYDGIRVLAGDLMLAQETSPPFNKRNADALLRFYQLLSSWIAAKEELTVAQLLDRVLDESRYAEVLRDGTEEGEERWANLQELRTVAAVYDEVPRDQALSMFLEEVALVSDQDDVPEDSDVPTLMTLHTAKGLEFRVVFIIGLEEGIIPHSRSYEDPESLEEERRLFYVGITRAKERLYLIHTFRRSLYGYTEVREPSRFLKDIPNTLVEGQGVQSRIESARAAVRRAASWDAYAQREAQTGAGESASVYWSPREPQAEKLPATEPQFAAGVRVRHPLFGEGTVISSKLADGDEEVTVAFPGKGVKRLLVSFARLEKI
ncbi:MAG TPA: DNA helicase UvrD [Anaerolineae bacterium]|nr:DNA helicase UvrD [Anaerolineae bacterium]